MKFSQGLTKWPANLGVFLCFCSGAALQAVGMKDRAMASSYTLVLGLEAVTAVTLGLLVLGERITAGKIIAMLLILCGMLWLERA